MPLKPSISRKSTALLALLRRATFNAAEANASYKRRFGRLVSTSCSARNSSFFSASLLSSISSYSWSSNLRLMSVSRRNARTLALAACTFDPIIRPKVPLAPSISWFACCLASSRDMPLSRQSMTITNHISSLRMCRVSQSARVVSSSSRSLLSCGWFS